MQDTDFEDAFNRIKQHKSVLALVVANLDGTFTRSSFTPDRKDEAELIAKSIPILALKARSMVRDVDPLNDLAFLRVKTKQNEILIVPDKAHLLIVIQGPKKSGDDEQ